MIYQVSMNSITSVNPKQWILLLWIGSDRLTFPGASPKSAFQVPSKWTTQGQNDLFKRGIRSYKKIHGSWVIGEVFFPVYFQGARCLLENNFQVLDVNLRRWMKPFLVCFFKGLFASGWDDIRGSSLKMLAFSMEIPTFWSIQLMPIAMCVPPLWSAWKGLLIM